MDGNRRNRNWLRRLLIYLVPFKSFFIKTILVSILAFILVFILMHLMLCAFDRWVSQFSLISVEYLIDKLALKSNETDEDRIDKLASIVADWIRRSLANVMISIVIGATANSTEIP